MKNKQTPFAAKLFCLLFFAMLALPSFLWLGLKGALDTGSRENRELASFPKPGEVPFSQMPAAYESWLSDHAPFRNQLTGLNAAVNWHVFSTIDSEDVLLGKEGWLFYQNAWDSASLDDYQGINPYTEEQMARIAEDLNQFQALLAERGTRLAVLVVPGKELVYRRYMPPDVPMVQPEGRIDQLALYLESRTQVPFLWPEEVLRNKGEKEQLYYRYDTHWNPAGAAYTAAWMLEQLDLEGPAAEELVFVPSNQPPLEDLANISYTWNLLPPDQNWRPETWMPDVRAQAVERDEAGFYQRFVSDGTNPQSLLVFRDSFGEALQAPLAACFSESAFVHINAWDETTLSENPADILVLEICQRYSDRLLDYLPRMIEWAE